MPFADVAGASLHYRFDGTAGAPVVMLSNSLGTDLSMWDPQVPALVARYRLLRYDTRGHGRSTATPGPYTIEGLAKDALGLLDALGIERVHFCGLSMGGMVGQWIGAHAPQRVDKLILCNTTARIGSPEAYNARIDTVRSSGMAAIVDTVLARWYTPSFAAAAPDAIARTRAMLLATPADGYAACCAAIRDMDQSETARDIAAPTLVIAGAHDLATPPADGRFLAERISRARLTELPAAHLSNIEAAGEFNVALVEFLSS
jgi:3-oxoadipate enol-lactonase